MSLPGPFETLLIFMAVLLLFGAKRLPEVGKSLGKGIKEFKGAMKGLSSDDEQEGNPQQPQHSQES